MDNYALPLFAIVDADKVDLRSRQLPELAERIGVHLGAAHGIQSLDARIEVLADEPYLILNGVENNVLPQLFALADVQRAQVFRYRRESAEQAVLIPLAIDPG